MVVTPSVAEDNAAPGPRESRRRMLAIWLPAVLSAAFLLIIGITFFWLSGQINVLRYRLTEVLEPKQRQLSQLHIAFLERVFAWRSYQIRPGAQSLAKVRATQRQADEIVDRLTAGASRVSPDFERDLASLRALLANAQAAPLAVMSGQLTLPQLNQSLPEQDLLVNNVNAKAAQIADQLSRQARQMSARLQELEQARLRFLIALFPLATVGIALTAWFARRAMQSHRRLLRHVAREALLRDAMTALTGTYVLPAALNRIATNAMHMSGASGAFIEHSDDTRMHVDIVASAGTDAPAATLRVPFQDSVTDKIVRAGTPELVQDLSGLEGKLKLTMEDHWEQCFALAVPLQTEGNVDGALVLVYRDRSTHARLETISWLQAMGAWAALALRRQKLASQLIAEQSRLEAVIKEMPVAVVLAEAPSGRIVLFNREALDLWGSPAAIPQRIEEYASWKTYRPNGQPYQAHERPLARSILSGEIVQGEEAEIERSDGTRRSVLINSAPVRDAQGAIIAAVATVADISTEKQREVVARFLDEISRQFSASLDYDATLETVLHLLVPRLGDFASVHHRVDDSVIRKGASAARDIKINEAFQNLDEEYPLPLPSTHPVSVAIRTGKPQLREMVSDDLLVAIARDERQLEWLRSLGLRSAMALPLNARGETIGALQIVSLNPAHHYNCNDLELAEEVAQRAALAIDNAHLFRTVVNNGRVARFLADTAHSLSTSLEYEEVLRRITRMAVPFFADFSMAYIRDDQGLAQHVASAHRDAEKETLLAEIARLYRPDPADPNSTVVRAIRTGQPVLIERVSPELLDSGKLEPRIRELLAQLAPVSFMTIPLVARDETLGSIVFASARLEHSYNQEDLELGQRIASRAALAMQNAALYRSMKQALNVRDEVLAVVSHDLRNPLNTIGLSVELLNDIELPDAQRRHHLDIVGRAKERMDRLIQDLLDVTRVEAGKALTIERLDENPARIIREACELFTTPAREKAVQFHCEVPDALPHVWVDSGRIGQVLSNLIGNAIKFTPEGGHIEVRAQQQQDMVLVSVQDSGPGIPPEDVENIFHAFWQSPRAARLGAGLGLTISRGIIEQHGGRIWVDSREGTGSTFLFTLPLADGRNEMRAAA